MLMETLTQAFTCMYTVTWRGNYKYSHLLVAPLFAKACIRAQTCDMTHEVPFYELRLATLGRRASGALIHPVRCIRLS
jgi:hypothetical protein